MNSDNGKSAMNNNSTFRTLYVRNPSLFDQFDTSTAGIDKLNILTKEFIVPTASRLNIDYYGRKANCEEATQERLFVSEEGEQVEGRKAYYNGQGYALNINNYGLQLVFSPAKVLQPDRPFILPTDAGDIDNATNSVINRIKHDTGVLISTDVAKVCRIDIARQKALQRPIRDYLQAFTMLRLKGSRNKTRQYSHQTFQYNTSSSGHQLQFYDKAAEYLATIPMGNILQEHRPLLHGSNYMRCELRLLRTDYIRQATNTDASYHNILNSGSELWDNIYRTYLRKKVFTGQYPTTLQFDANNIRRLFDTLQGNKEAARIVPKVLQVIGVRTLLEDIGIDAFLSIAAERGITDRHIRRIRTKIEQDARHAAEFYQPIETLQLINELRNAFAA